MTQLKNSPKNTPKNNLKSKVACNIAYITKIDIDILYNITARTHTREIGKPGVLMGTHDPISFMPAGAGYCTDDGG